MEEKLVFGIDLGIASCGWAVLKMPDFSGAEDKGEILAAGRVMNVRANPSARKSVGGRCRIILPQK